jgi:hypothetical protein
VHRSEALEGANLKEEVDNIQIGNEEHSSKRTKKKDKEEGKLGTGRIIAVNTRHLSKIYPGKSWIRSFVPDQS